jgi:transposase
MLTLSPAVRIYLASGATDLRRSIDGLSAVVRERFGLDPLSGHLFLFRNRRGDRLKILVWDQSGFWILYKRLEQGTFAWPTEADTRPVEMRSGDLLLLLLGRRPGTYASPPPGGRLRVRMGVGRRCDDSIDKLLRVNTQ